MTTCLHCLRGYRPSRLPIASHRKSHIFESDGGRILHLYIPSFDPCSYAHNSSLVTVTSHLGIIVVHQQLELFLGSGWIQLVPIVFQPAELAFRVGFPCLGTGPSLFSQHKGVAIACHSRDLSETHRRTQIVQC